MKAVGLNHRRGAALIPKIKLIGGCGVVACRMEVSQYKPMNISSPMQSNCQPPKELKGIK